MGYTVKCPECWHELQIGDFPFCPHGSVVPKHKLFSGYYDAELADQPVYIESAQHLDREVKRRNLQIRNNEHLDDINHRRDRMGMPPARI